MNKGGTALIRPLHPVDAEGFFYGKLEGENE